MDKDPRKTYFNTITQFKLIECKRIGKGSFGEVRLALHIETNKMYAIKIVNVCLTQVEQQEIDTEVGCKALEREIKLHVGIDHPNIVRLWQVFKEGSTVYMVMDYIEKGNLFYYQNEKKVFSEDQSSVFFSQTLSAIDYLHSMNLMHRDLKPENLLLDSNYNIKICDLGWVVQGINEKHATFCGTYEYMAPEMIFGNNYDYKIDIWALGILLYQLLHGFAPFQGQTLEEVKDTMMKGDIHIDPNLSENVQNLIFNILKVLPEQRLTAKEIRAHPWMNDMKRKRIQELTLKGNNRKSERALKKQVSIPNSLKLKSIEYEKQACKMSLAKKEHKRQTNNFKNYLSSQNLKIAKKQKHRTSQKQNFIKLLKKNSEIQKLLKTHHHQSSDFSQLCKKPKRLITEVSGERSIKNEKVIRFNTEMSEGFDLSCYKSSSAKKKKTMPKKNILSVAPNFLKSSCKSKINRKSID